MSSQPVFGRSRQSWPRLVAILSGQHAAYSPQSWPRSLIGTRWRQADAGPVFVRTCEVSGQGATVENPRHTHPQPLLCKLVSQEKEL